MKIYLLLSSKWWNSNMLFQLFLLYLSLYNSNKFAKHNLSFDDNYIKCSCSALQNLQHHSLHYLSTVKRLASTWQYGKMPRYIHFTKKGQLQSNFSLSSVSWWKVIGSVTKQEWLQMLVHTLHNHSQFWFPRHSIGPDMEHRADFPTSLEFLPWQQGSIW